MLKNLFLGGFFLLVSSVGVAGITDFVPQGRVRLVDQLRIKFDKSMTDWIKSHKYGELPFTSNCLDDHWNEWTDDRNLIVHYSVAKSSGVRCVFKSTVDQKSFEFIVAGPNILVMTPRNSIDPDQVFVAAFDGKFSKEKVLAKSYFVAEGLGDRIAIVEATADEKNSANEHILKNEYGFPGLKKEKNKITFESPVLYFKATRSFPANTKISFVLPKEISESSVAPLSDQVLSFKSIDDFKASFNCTRESADKPCVPMESMDVSFTSELSVADAKKIYLQSSTGKKIPAVTNEQDDRSQTSSVRFQGPFEENMKLQVFIPAGLKDILGRKLVNENMFPLSVATSGYPALLKFAASFGLYEAADPVVPVTLRNVLDQSSKNISGYTKNLIALSNAQILKQMQDWTNSPYGKLSLLAEPNDFKKVEYHRAEADEQTEVLGLPMNGTGVHLLELKSDQLGRRLLEAEVPFYVRTVAVVSNMAIHIKSTETELQTWVTNLTSTEPVSAAEVEILSCGGESFGKAKTNQNGLANLRPSKPLTYKNLKYCEQGGKFSSGFVVMARKGTDVAIASSTWDQGISRWRFGVPMPFGEKDLIAHAVLDRNLIRPNETLHMKIFARMMNANGLRMPKPEELPKEMIVQHSYSGEQIKMPLKWNLASGTYVGELAITAKMKLGRWNINLKSKKESVQAGSFDVQQYQIPMVEVKILASTDPLVAVSKIPYQVNAQYLAGGAADSLFMTETWSTSKYYPSFSGKDRKGFSVLSGKVEEGIKKSNYEYADEDSDTEVKNVAKLHSKKFALNKTGGIANQIEGVPQDSEPQVVNLNLEYRDPNGELQNKGRSFIIWGADRILGVKLDKDSNNGMLVKAKALVTDLSEKAFAAAKVKFTVYEKVNFSHRKRLVGGFYSYESFNEVRSIGMNCEKETDKEGMATCDLKMPKAGQYFVVAQTADGKGNQVFAKDLTYIRGKNESYWDDSEDSDRMDLVLDKERYFPGDTAKLTAKIPFSKGHYLVTIEREGVIQSNVYELKEAAPEIKIPIKKEFAPNVFVSVFAIRGRVADYKPTALIDLGKPTYRMGVTELKVSFVQNKLNVKVQTDAKTYHVRDTAKVKISVTDHLNKPVKGQVILAGIDEGLLYLAPNTTWNLVENMIRVRGLSVDTATSLTEVVGRRHYGKKAIANGGDGRGAQLRDQMDSLLIWKSELNLNEAGEAIVDVPLNDSLTAFRLVAIASQGVDQFGTGSTSIRSTQDVMIFSGLPSFTRQGDLLNASVTVRNSSNRNIDGELQASWNGVPLEIKKTNLPSEKSNVYEWKVKAQEVGTAKFIAEFKSSGGKREDGISKPVSVQSLAALRNQADVLYKLEGLRSWPLAFRPDLKPDSGVVDVKLNSELKVDSKMMKEFWDDYPYSCLEQQISRAVSLKDEKLWSKINRNLSAYTSNSGLLKFFPETRSNSSGSISLTTYYVLMAKAQKFEVAQESKIKEALKSYIQGRILDSYKLDEAMKLNFKIFAAEALVKLGALSAAERVQFMPELDKIPLSSLWSLREIHLGVPSSANYLTLINQQIKSRLSLSGSEANFEDDSWSWISLSNTQVNLARAIMWPDLSNDDLGRLLTATQRRVGPYMWQSTIGNAWLSVALSEVKEKLKSKVTGTTDVSLGGARTSKTWSGTELDISDLQVPLNTGLMQIYHKGTGSPWMTAMFKARRDVATEVQQGIQVLPISPEMLQKNYNSNTDDISILEFNLNASQNLNLVALEVPLPPGAMVADIETNAAVEFEERRYESLKLYLAGLEKGATKFKISLRTNQKGIFNVPGPHAEAMYSPQYQGEYPAVKWNVQ